jgi:hypothetical protein
MSATETPDTEFDLDVRVSERFEATPDQRGSPMGRPSEPQSWTCYTCRSCDCENRAPRVLDRCR